MHLGLGHQSGVFRDVVERHTERLCVERDTDLWRSCGDHGLCPKCPCFHFLSILPTTTLVMQFGLGTPSLFTSPCVYSPGHEHDPIEFEQKLCLHDIGVNLMLRNKLTVSRPRASVLWGKTVWRNRSNSTCN